VVTLTAIRLQLGAVQKVDACAAVGSVWEAARGPSDLPVAFRDED
jgi:hypothetical protein